MTHRLATNFAKNYCNRTPIAKVIVENVVTCFLGDTVYLVQPEEDGGKITNRDGIQLPFSSRQM